MHVHQFWWAWSLWFRRYCYSQKRPNFPFDPWTIVHFFLFFFFNNKHYQTNTHYKLVNVMESMVHKICMGEQKLDYSPLSSKNLIDRNRLKKFMQVGIDVTCMYTNFGGCGLFGFRDTVTLRNGQISLSTHGL